MKLETHIARHDEEVKQVVLRISNVAKKISRGFATRRGASESLKVMEYCKITSLPVVDDGGRLVGVVHLHDLWRTELF